MEKLPGVFDRVELGIFRRQDDDGDIGRHQDRVQSSKAPSLQSHRQMGLVMHDCSDGAALNDDLGFPQRVEDFAVEQLVPQATSLTPVRRIASVMF